MTIGTQKCMDGSCGHGLEWELDSNPTMSEMSSDRSSPSSQWPDTPQESEVTDCRERRKLRNEDSSYDSDFDPCEPSSPRREEAHEDVSRTASETLGAEFAEYVTLDDKKTDNTLAVITASPEYSQYVEFGVKLGYSENLIQLALLKLGLNPEKNKLLDELIRLGAGAPKPDTDVDDADLSEDRPEKSASQLRPVIIDGSNVAMSHGGKTNTFSCKGIRLCVDWFKNRGHNELVVIVPSFRKEASKVGSVITDQNILYDLEKEGILTFTPSRSTGGKRIVPYDDRYILKEAIHTGGVIVSNDIYRDLVKEIPAFRKVVEESLLMFSFVNGRFEPPDDPLGRNGPSLDVFLRKRGSNKDAKTCPYLGKCTYGNKCKYTHPERGNAPIKSVTERLNEQAQKHYQDKEKAKSRDPSPGEKLRGKSLSLSTEGGGKKPLTRTQSNTPGGKGPWGKDLSQASISAKMSAPSIVTSAYDPMMNSAIADSLFSSCPTQKPPPYGAGWPWSSQPCDPAMFSSMQKTADHEVAPNDNPHPKLQRQLSINPVHDTRLNKKYLTEGDYANVGQHPGQSVGLPQQRLQQHFRAEEHIRPTTPCMTASFANYPGGRDQLHAPYHPPLTRHSSSQESKSISSYSQPMYQSYMHTSVTRNLSAPDAMWGENSKRTHPHGRLNSTSDSRLDLHGCGSQLYGDPFEETSQRPYLQAPGPVGSRPISPHQLPIIPQSIPSRVSQHVTQSTSLNPTVGMKPYEDERFKIFYHLSQLFPEAQVRAALVGNPQETDPTKICASILSAAKGNTRSISPPQMTSNFGTIGGAHVPLRGSSSLGTGFSSSTVDSQREVARMEAYSALSKLFLEEQVRKVMAAYPEETDSNKFCQLLLALNRPQS